MSAPRIVMMGVSGCGKSTVGARVAAALGVHFVEGDVLHSPENVARMAAGIALTDADRHGWLQAVGDQLGSATAQAHGVVVSCSALKRAYRDRLRASAPDVRFVHLAGSAELLQRRLGERRGHYMPASLLQSQLDTLEPPAEDEHAIVVDIADTPDALVAQVLRALEVAPA